MSTLWPSSFVESLSVLMKHSLMKIVAKLSGSKRENNISSAEHLRHKNNVKASFIHT